MFNIITGINKSKTLTKHISCEFKCKFDGRTCNSNQWWNNDKGRCECKKHHICEKDYVWNPAKRNSKNGKDLASIMDDSMIKWDEIIQLYKADADAEAKLNDEAKSYDKVSFNERKQPVKCKISIVY